MVRELKSLWEDYTPARIEVKSIWDEDTPASIRERTEKGLAAWERAHSLEDEAAQLNELRDAYSHLRLAAKEAKRDRYAEIMFYGNMSGLMTAEISKWKDRHKAAKQAFEGALREVGWLLVLYGTVVEDVSEIELAPARARAQLFEDAHRHTETSYGLALIGGMVMGHHRMPPALKRQYKGLAKQIGEEIATRLASVEGYGSSSPDAAAIPLGVEMIADAIAEQEVSREYSVVLYKALADLPDEDWDQAEGDQPARTAEEHRDHAEARLEFARAGGRGCGFGILAAAFAIGIGALLATSTRHSRLARHSPKPEPERQHDPHPSTGSG